MGPLDTLAVFAMIFTRHSLLSFACHRWVVRMVTVRNEVMFFQIFQRKVMDCVGCMACAICFFLTSFASAEETAKASESWRPVQGSSCILIQEKSVIPDTSHQPMVYWRFQNACEEPITFSYHLIAQAATGWNTIIKSTKTIPLIVHLEAKQVQKGDDGIFGQFAPGTGIRSVRVFIQVAPKLLASSGVPEPVKSRSPDLNVATSPSSLSGPVAPESSSSEQKKVLPFCKNWATVMLGTCRCLPGSKPDSDRDAGKLVCIPIEREQKGSSNGIGTGVPFGPPAPPLLKSPVVVMCNPSVQSCP